LDQPWASLEIAGISVQLVGVLALVFTLVLREKSHRTALVPFSVLRAWRWIAKTFRRRAQRTVQVAGSLGGITASARGSGYVSIGDLAGKPLHEQIEVLKRHINEHAREISATQGRLSAEAETRARDDEEERLARESAMSSLQETLDQAKLLELRRQLWYELVFVVIGLILVLAATVGAIIAG